MFEIGPVFQYLWQMASQALTSAGFPDWTASATIMVGQTAVLMGVVLLMPLALVYAERKISAFMQGRLGPMETGPFGLLQTVADGVKLFLKQDVIPVGSDAFVHRLAPVIAAAPIFAGFAPLAYGQGLMLMNLDAGVLWVFAISGLTTLGVLMGGWSSGNKFSMLGGIRAVAQIVSYEIPRIMAVVPILMVVGSQGFADIVQAQTGRWHGIPQWFILYPHPLFPIIGVISFVIFLICSIAETNRTPFDIPEAEAELVAGFHTEFSGMKFALFFLAEYAHVVLGSAMAVALFFGGADGYYANGYLPSWLWFLAKTSVLVFCFMWVRWTFPRMRMDQLLAFCWKFLLPWSIVNIGLAGAWMLRGSFFP